MGFVCDLTARLRFVRMYSQIRMLFILVMDETTVSLPELVVLLCFLFFFLFVVKLNTVQNKTTRNITIQE